MMAGRIDEFGHVDNGMFAEDYIEQLEQELKLLRPVAEAALGFFRDSVKVKGIGSNLFNAIETWQEAKPMPVVCEARRLLQQYNGRTDVLLKWTQELEQANEYLQRDAGIAALKRDAALEREKGLREIAQTLLYSLATARHESIGSIDSHRSAKYSQREIEHIRQVLERSGD